MLEAYGFVTKHVAADKKSKFVYRLTEKGIALVPVIMKIGLWGSVYNPPELNTQLLSALQQDEEETIQRIQEHLRRQE